MTEHIKGLNGWRTGTIGDHPDKDKLGPLQKHHLLYHQGDRPEYWSKVHSKYLTAFNRQVAEGALLTCSLQDTDIILHSKGETIGESIKIKTVQRDCREFSMVVGNTARYSTREQKLLVDL